MGYIPIFLDVTGRECVVVGGGEVAARKVESLLEAGARVTVVSPRLSPSMETFVANGSVTHLARNYQRGDINGCVLVYAATDDPKLHRELAAEARALGIPVNVVDVPELCTLHRARGRETRRASNRNLDRRRITGICGAAQAQSGRSVWDEYARTLEVLRAARRRLHADEIDPAERMRRLKDLANSALPDAIAAGDVAAIDRILATHLGDGVSLAALGLGRADDFH